MSTPTSERHHRLAAERGPVGIAIVTVSDSRTPESDDNAAYLRDAIAAAGHRATGYHLVRDEAAEVVGALEAIAEEGAARIALFNGGTGISRRDGTFEALSTRIEKTIPGFGELFRMLSWEQVGAAAMLSRATAGTYRGLVIVSTPGSPAAVRLAWERLILPEIEHLAWEMDR